MRFSLLLALPLLSRAQAPAPAQNSTQISALTSLGQFLRTSNLTSFVNAVEGVGTSPVGSQFIAEVVNAATGNRSLTIFIPDNNAFTGSPPKNITDPDILAGILTYHLIEGELTTSNIASPPGYTIVRTFMNTSNLVQLEGNESQVLALTNSNGTIKVLGQNTPVQVVSAISLPQNITNKNLKAYILNAVLDPPPVLRDALVSTNLSAFQAAAQQASYLTSLESARGVTIFAPSNEAAASLISANNTNLSNVSTLTALLGNHIINGTTVYSTQLPLNTTSASGEPLIISTNSSGTFVKSGSSTAKITQPDILVSNGVVHVIDGVLFNTAVNQTAANSAFASATSAAATAASAQATQTSPVGNTGPSGSGSSGSNSTSNGNNKNSGVMNSKVSYGHVASFLFLIALIYSTA